MNKKLGSVLPIMAVLFTVPAMADTECGIGQHKEQQSQSLLEIFTAKATNPDSTSVNTSGYRNNSNTYADIYGSKGQTYYGLTDPNTWAADYAGFGMVRGSAMCSTRARVGSGFEVVEGDGDLPGGFNVGDSKYCYCNITSYTDANGGEMSLSSPWVFSADGGNASRCAAYCAYYCAAYAVLDSGFRSAVLGSVTATVAACVADVYKIEPGQYLASGATAGATCPAGSFCVGSTGDGFTFSATENQGIESCPAEYATSDAGAKTQSECYHACTTDDIEHSTSVTGNVYQNGKNTCDPACAGGWHKEQFSLLETFTAKATNPNSASVNTAGYRDNSNAYEDRYGSKGQSYYGLTDPNTWAVDWAGFGMVRGSAMCSTQPGDNQNYTWTNPTIRETLADEFGTGKYCYCNITSYKDTNGGEMSLSSPWVFLGGYGYASDCAGSCAYHCASYAVGYSGCRSALFGPATAPAASCSANQYKLKWQDAAGNVTETTETVHGGSIIAPSTVPTKIGHTFKGWKLKKSAN